MFRKMKMRWGRHPCTKNCLCTARKDTDGGWLVSDPCLLVGNRWQPGLLFRVLDDPDSRPMVV